MDEVRKQNNLLSRLPLEFYTRDAETVAKNLLGCKIVLKNSSGEFQSFAINETEAYLGENDKACHASKGRTTRTEVMYMQGGVIYMYLIYGMYWMMNVVCSHKDHPQAVLIRGAGKISGPGRLTKALHIDKSFNTESLIHSKRIWIAPGESNPAFVSVPRVGIDYAGEYWSMRKLRYIVQK